MAKHVSCRWHQFALGFWIAVSAAALIAVASSSVRAQAGGRMGGQGHFRPDSKFEAERLFHNAAEHERNGQWSEAVTIYQKIIQRFGDTMSEVSREGGRKNDLQGETRLYLDTRQNCQRHVAAMPPEARAIYRRRADPEAERWYRQGAAERDRSLLRRVLDEAFCSSWGDDALDLLGDLAFQEGRFAEALEAYGRLVPDRPDEPGPLVHPDPDVDLARVAAKKLLCRAALGINPPSRADLEAFAKAYPDAQGPFAGRNGRLLKCLTDALANDRIDQALPADGRWPTFAGAPSRTKIVPGPIDVGSFQWKVKLDAPEKMMRQPPNGFMPRGFNVPPPLPPSLADRPVPYHPIVVGDLVVVGDERKVVAYNLAGRTAPVSSVTPGTTEEPRVVWEQSPVGQFTSSQTGRTLQNGPHYTLTAFGDRIYARLGPPSLRQGASSCIIAIRSTREIEGKLLWKRNASEIELPRHGAGGVKASFEGTPVADAEHVYIALTEGGNMLSTYVACLDAETGNPRWVRGVGAAASAFDNGMGMLLNGEVGGRLLTLDGSTIYYQTNLGAVAALDAESGSIKWLAAYDHQEPHGPGIGVGRDLNPAVVHEGLVLVAPDDSANLYAFDASTGRLVWRSEELRSAVHVLGVAKGHLFLTGDRVYMLEVKTGKRLRYWPEAGQGHEAYGRGLLSGDSVYWPTKDRIYVLSQETGVPAADRPPIELKEAFGATGGNLAVGDGYLVVASPEALLVFCQNSRLIERYREQIARSPDQAATYVRLARVAEATGQDELALSSLEGAIAKARPAELFDGQPLAEQARVRRYGLLMQMGAKAGHDGRWAEAGRRYEEAAKTARGERDRLTARLRLADAQERDDDARGAVATLQAILGDEGLRRLSVAADERRTIRADLLIADRLGAILREGKAKDRDLYEPYDRQARELLDRGRAERDPHLLEEIGHSFPAAQVVPDALLELALLLEVEHPADAARAYKQLLALAPNDAFKARALWGLGRAYEAQKLWLPARDAYLRAQARFADVRIDDVRSAAGSGTIGSLVADRLAHEPFNRMAAERAESVPSLPLTRGWTVTWDNDARPIVAEGTPPSAEAGTIFLAEGTVLRPIDPGTGSSAWSVDLKAEPIWVAYLADRVVAATAERLVALDLHTGAVRWKFQAVDPRPSRRLPDPFAKADARAPAAASTGMLHDLRLAGGRVFCVRGERELLAIDGESGLVDWSFAPTSGSLSPRLLAGPERVVLQVRRPNAILVLETATGRHRAEYRQGPESDPWSRDPLALDDDRVAFVEGDRAIELFDLSRGTSAWTYKEVNVLPRTGPPRLLGDAGRLFALRDGSELLRLDPATGLRVWSRLLGVDDLSEAPAALVLDGDYLYAACGQAVIACRASDGAVAWRRPLLGPAGGWSLALTRVGIAAYPDPARSDEGGLDALPLVFYRRDDGRLLQRLVFPAPVNRLAVKVAAPSPVIATQAGGWSLTHWSGGEATKP